jgi:acyl carrier protein
VMAPKVAGAWLLHTMTIGKPLDHFVMFSSLASLLGSPGQGNHSSANAFLDALAQYRRQRGLPGLSINWGAWSDVGASARHHSDERIYRRGLGIMSPSQGLQAMQTVMSGDAAQVGVTPVNWSTFLGHGGAEEGHPFFSQMAKDLRRGQESVLVPSSAASRVDSTFLARLQGVYPNKQRSFLLNHVQECATTILGLGPSAPIDWQQPLSEMGLDSLMAVELRNVLSESLECSLAATLLFDYPTILSLGDFLAGELLGEESAHSKQESSDEETDDLLSMIEDISEDDVDRLLGDRLTRRQDG